MADADNTVSSNQSQTKEGNSVRDNQDRLDGASIALYRALAVNNLLFEAVSDNDEGKHLRDDALCGAVDALDKMLKEAKDLIDSVKIRGQGVIMNDKNFNLADEPKMKVMSADCCSQSNAEKNNHALQCCEEDS